MEAKGSLCASRLTFCMLKATRCNKLSNQITPNGVPIATSTGMTKYLKIFAISALLLAPASLADAQVTFGVRIGEPPAPRAYAVPA